MTTFTELKNYLRNSFWCTQDAPSLDANWPQLHSVTLHIMPPVDDAICSGLMCVGVERCPTEREALIGMGWSRCITSCSEAVSGGGGDGLGKGAEVAKIVGDFSKSLSSVVGGGVDLTAAILAFFYTRHKRKAE